MKHKLIMFPSLMMATMLIFLTGCSLNSDDNNNDPEIAQTALLQVVHASPDAPKVDLVFDDSTVASSVDYGAATAQLTVDAGIHTAAVKALLADGNNIDAFSPATLDLVADKAYTVLAVGETASIEPLVLVRDNTAVTAGNARVQIVHAAPNAPMVDVYVTAPDADLAGSTPVVTADFKASLDATEIAFGDYQIRITLAGDASNVVFDSGTINLPDGADLLVAAIENTGPGEQAVNLLLIDSNGASVLLDAATPAWLRVVHSSPDAPAVDVVANDNFAQPLVSDLSFGEFAGYIPVAAADYNVKVVPTGTETPVVINADLSLAAGTSYQVIAADNLADIQPLVLTADNRRVITEAKLRLIHSSPTASNVDIYLVASGTDISTVEPTLSDVPLFADTDFLSVLPGDYDVIITPTGSKDAAIGPLTVGLEGGGIYTAIAVDAAGGGAPLGVILLDDFVQTF